MAESLAGAPASELSDRLRGKQLPHIGILTRDVLDCAKPDVLYSHSGPAHRGVCATGEVMDGSRSRIPQEALNAIYAKKALLALMVK